MGISLEDLQNQHRPTDSATSVTFLPEPERAERWATIVSVDDHVVEPPDIFDGRFPERYEADAPRIVDTENGGQAWQWLGRILPNIGFNAVVGRPRREHTFEPTRFEHMRAGAWDVSQRVADMDLNGIWASLCFPSFLPGFAGQRLTLWPEDEGLALAAMRAYNDWHFDAWCGYAPERFIPVQISWLRDAVVAAEEIRRNADRGFRAVSFTEAPHKLGLPSIHSGYWDPFFEACAETSTVICLHVGSAGETPTTSDDAPYGLAAALFQASAFTYTVDWLYSGVATRFPDVKICMSEGGLGWVGAVADRLDHLCSRDTDDRSYQPTSDLLRRNFWFCALDDPSGFLAKDIIGIENILVEADYPHSDSTWPNTQALLKKHLSSLTLDEQQKVCWQNAVELFRHPRPLHPLPTR